MSQQAFTTPTTWRWRRRRRRLPHIGRRQTRDGAERLPLPPAEAAAQAVNRQPQRGRTASRRDITARLSPLVVATRFTLGQDDLSATSSGPACRAL